MYQRIKMSETAVQFLVERYNIDEGKARSFIHLYKTINKDQVAPPSTVGVLTPEELLELQQRQQTLTTGALPPTPERIQVSVPQSFRAGGTVPGGPTQTPGEEEESWWEAVWPWGYMQLWQTIEPAVWAASILGSSYYGGRALATPQLGLPFRAAAPSYRVPLLGRVTQGATPTELLAARGNPQFGEALAQYYEGGRVGPRPTITPEQIRQSRLLSSPGGRNLLERVVNLGLPQSAVTQLTEAEIIEAEAEPLYARELENWYRQGANPMRRPISPNVTYAPRTTQPLVTTQTPSPLLGTRTTTTTPTTRTPASQPGFWSRTGTRIRGAIPSRTAGVPTTGTIGTTTSTTTPAAQTGFWNNLRGSITAGGRNLSQYLFGGGAAGGLGAIYAPAASTLIAAAIPLAGIIGARTVGGALAPEYHEELSRQGYNEWIRPYVPILTPAASTPEGRQQQFELTRASRPFWAGIEQAGRQLGAFTWPWEQEHEAYINP